ncbi:hypothetical protein ABKN59_005750 [Abortiporus biennis]
MYIHITFNVYHISRPILFLAASTYICVPGSRPPLVTITAVASSSKQFIPIFALAHHQQDFSMIAVSRISLIVHPFPIIKPSLALSRFSPQTVLRPFHFNDHVLRIRRVSFSLAGFERQPNQKRNIHQAFQFQCLTFKPQIRGDVTHSNGKRRAYPIVQRLLLRSFGIVPTIIRHFVQCVSSFPPSPSPNSSIQITFLPDSHFSLKVIF